MLGGRPQARDMNLAADKSSSEVNTGNCWVPILDYAVLKGVSTSTLRRYIKAKKIQYKIENGRYLLLADKDSATGNLLRSWDGAAGSASEIMGMASRNSESANDGISSAKVRDLEVKLLQAQEQISELKMLVAIYEEKLAQLGS